MKANSFEKFEKPYWGDNPKLTPEQIVEWLEGYREMMMVIKTEEKKSHDKEVD